jgi:hypothetical protein
LAGGAKSEGEGGCHGELRLLAGQAVRADGAAFSEEAAMTGGSGDLGISASTKGSSDPRKHGVAQDDLPAPARCTGDC